MSDDHSAVRTSQEAILEAERDGLRVALAAARGTILDLRSHVADLRAAQEFLRLSRQSVEIEIRDLRQRVATAQAELERCEALRLTERTWLLAERDALAPRAKALDRLVRDLRWENGPRSVQAVLPLARLVRRVGGG